MEHSTITHAVREKFRLMLPLFTERTRRLWCAVEARQIGRGGISVVHDATGVAISTIRRGIKELEQPVELTPMQSRHNGGGRKSLTEHYTDLHRLSNLQWC